MYFLFAEKEKYQRKAAQKSNLMALLSHGPPPHGAQSHQVRTFLGLANALIEICFDSKSDTFIKSVLKLYFLKLNSIQNILSELGSSRIRCGGKTVIGANCSLFRGV
jgi:hypothetical protein